MPRTKRIFTLLSFALVILLTAGILRKSVKEAMTQITETVNEAEQLPETPPHDDKSHAATPAHPRPGTVDDRKRQYGKVVRDCFRADFHHSRVSYPPERVVLVGIKDARRLEVYAANRDDNMQFIRAYPMLAASGSLGPKIREGDMQVPEGNYSIEFLNPNSSYHLALRINYPNAFDRRMARREKRTNLGGDIMIHGSNASAGCIAVGDAAAEDLFILAAETGISRVSILLTPVDFRCRNLPADLPKMPSWSNELYTMLKSELEKLP